MSIFKRDNKHFTNGSGIYVECHNGYYLKMVRSGNATPVMEKLLCKGDSARYFPNWKPISKSKWDKESEAARAGWQDWMTQTQMEFAFEMDGKRYFLLRADTMPAGRFYAAQVTLDELRCGMDAETHIAFCDAIDEAINKGDLARVAVLNKERRTRAQIGASADLVLRFASVMIVEEGEDITTYDPRTNHAKIEAWKKGVGDRFFSCAPASLILPFLHLSEEKMEERIELARELDKSGLIARLTKSSKRP